ncbi:glycosyltransferase family 4 protein [Parasediminibacterium paludis]|uniref:Glycosyltransferase family 4 protein n=1 Tax=Parasediminibacterium paludis TaxID=908966 RepID=A0ABV8Q1W1_9BACT
MKVLYDYQIFGMQDYGGISRIYTELLKAKLPENNFIPELPLRFSNNYYLNELKNVQYYPFFPKMALFKKVQIMNKFNKNYSINKIKLSKFDIFHPTYYDPYFLPYLDKKPFVITFFDMIHEKFGSQYKEFAQDKTIYEGKQQLVKHAARIISISESTRKDLIEYFNVPAEKIDVIHLATSLGKSNNEPIIKGDYLLFVGRRERYKNFNMLIVSLQPLFQNNKNLKLICAGGGIFSDDEVALINNLGIQDQVLQLPFNKDNILSNLYTHALAFLFPSLYEGFGIPVLEAFACGCPLILSNTSSLPEVAGDAAAYFNPYEANSILNSVNSVLHNNAYRQQLKEKGILRANNFSWKKTLMETENTYKKIAI